MNITVCRNIFAAVLLSPYTLTALPAFSIDSSRQQSGLSQSSSQSASQSNLPAPSPAPASEPFMPAPAPPISQLAAVSVPAPQPAPPHLIPSSFPGGQDSIDALQGLRIIVPLVLESAINSDVAKPGDAIDARLKDDLLWGKLLVAGKNSRVRGHVVSSEQARTLSQALMSSDRRAQSRGCITVQFDEILDRDGRKLNIEGIPCKQSSATTTVDGKGHRELATDSSGRIIKAEAALSHNQKVAYNAVRAATVLPIPASLLINAVGVPLALGAAGAASPSFAYNKPVDPSMEHKRAKGFAYAFVTNLPGAFFVQSVIDKGNEVMVNPGDELLVDIRIKPLSQTAQGPILDVTGSVLPKQQDQDPAAQISLPPAQQKPAAVHSDLILPNTGGAPLLP